MRAWLRRRVRSATSPDRATCKFLEKSLACSGLSLSLKGKRRTHSRKQPSVDGMRLSPCATRLGKPTRLQGVDLHERKTPAKFGLEKLVTGACRFINDPRNPKFQPCPGLPEALLDVVELDVLMGSTVLAQPKGSSIFFRQRCESA